jgi:hypothetical protein
MYTLGEEKFWEETRTKHVIKVDNRIIIEATVS